MYALSQTLSNALLSQECVFALERPSVPWIRGWDQDPVFLLLALSGTFFSSFIPYSLFFMCSTRSFRNGSKFYLNIKTPWKIVNILISILHLKVKFGWVSWVAQGHIVSKWFGGKVAFLSPRINHLTSNNSPHFSGPVFFKLYSTSLWSSWLECNLRECEAVAIFHQIKS